MQTPLLPFATQCVHRTMNEVRERRAPSAAASLKVECECDRIECGADFSIALVDYRDVRRNAERFVMTPAHRPAGHAVLAASSEYVVVRLRD